jgi:hypothetical protein
MSQFNTNDKKQKIQAGFVFSAQLILGDYTQKIKKRKTRNL